MLQHRFGQRIDIVQRWREPAFVKRTGACRQHQGLAGAGTRAPDNVFVGQFVAVAGAGRADKRKDRVHNLVADRHLADERLDFHHAFSVDNLTCLARCGACRVEQYLAFGGKLGIADIHLQQEAVELRFRQWIGAFLFQRVLGCENVEGFRQIVTLAGHGDVIFLHGLQQCGLRARAGAVDFIRHQQLRKHRTFYEAEGAPPVFILIHDFGAENIRRHEVRCELDAVGIKPENRSERGDELGLGKPGNADEQRVAAREYCEKRVLHHFFLAEDDLGYLRADRGNIRKRLFGRGDDGFFVEGFAGIHHAHVALLIPLPPTHSCPDLDGHWPERISRCN